MDAPEIAVGTGVDNEGVSVVRLVIVFDGAQQCVVDLMPENARGMAAILAEAAARAETEDAENTRVAQLLLNDLERREGGL